MTDYETVPYVGQPIATAHPWRLAWTSFVHGGPRPDLSRARVLELGCGDGATALAIAAWEPSWRVRGLDASPRAIAAAQRPGVPNATFACADLATAAVEPGAWDVVIAHGLYSWIDADRRTALRRIVRRALSPGGLAYVSFNALPAWAVRGRVRDALVRHDAKALLERLEALAPPNLWGGLLSHELKRAHGARDDYFAHEYLAEHNDAFWVGDFARDAEADGLHWIGDAQFDLPEGQPCEAIKAALAVDGMRGEELADLAGYRQFRCAVLALEPRGRPATDRDILDAAFVSGVVSPAREAFLLDAGVEETMTCASGLELRVEAALSKAALVELARIHPDGLRMSELVSRARGLLASRRVSEGPDDERALRDGVLRVWRAGGLQMRLHRPRVSVEGSVASAFTRYEASIRSMLSTPLGVPIPMSRSDLAAIARMPLQADPTLLSTLGRWGLLS
jgi:SAM-dependent methyltransferase